MYGYLSRNALLACSDYMLTTSTALSPGAEAARAALKLSDGPQCGGRPDQCQWVSASRLVFGVRRFLLGSLLRVFLSTQRLCLMLLFGLFLVDDLGEELLHFLGDACR